MLHPHPQVTLSAASRIAISAAIAVLACAGSARAEQLRLQRVPGSAVAEVVTNPSLPGVVYLRRPSEVAYRADDGRLKGRYTVPAGCRPVARAPDGIVGLQCAGDANEPIALLDPRTGSVSPVTLALADQQEYYLADIGRRWIRVSVYEAAGDAPGGHQRVAEALINRRSGRLIWLDNYAIGPDTVLDLDATPPTRTCVGAARQPFQAIYDVPARPAAYIAGRLLQYDLPTQDGVGAQLTNCRTGSTRRLPGDGYFGLRAINTHYLTLPDADYAHGFTLQQIGTRSAQHFKIARRATVGINQVRLSAGAAWVTQGSSNLYRLRLPQTASVGQARAATAQPWQTFTVPGQATVASDGESFAAVDGEPGHVWIFEDASPASGFRDVAIDPECGFGGAVGRGGLLLLGCQDPQGTRVFNYRTGTTIAVAPGPAESPLSRIYLPVAVGTDWLRSLDSDGFEEYLNTATGELRSLNEVNVFPDLDSAALGVPMCAPVTRYGYAEPSSPYQQHPSLETPVRMGASFLMRARAKHRRIDLVRWQCGRKRAVRFAHCGPLTDCQRLQTGAGYATWQGDDGVVAGRVAPRRIVRTRFPPGPPGVPTGVAHTRAFVFASIQHADGSTTIATRPQPFATR